MDFLDDHLFQMVCQFYRLSLPCTTKVVPVSVYVSTAVKYDLLDIKATNCIVAAHLTKFAISIFFLVIDREPFDLSPTFFFFFFFFFF